jgi:GNAT superfamily N-acetyltransferase
VIRPRTAGDLPACVAALRLVHEADGYPSRWPADPARFLTPVGLHGAWVATPDGSVAAHGVLCDSRDVAPAAATLAEAAGVPEDRLLTVARLFVVPAARGTGLGRTMLDHLVAAAAAAGARPVLDVVAADPAVGFYDRAGWRRVTSLPAGWTDSTGAHPLLHYYLASD